MRMIPRTPATPPPPRRATGARRTRILFATAAGLVVALCTTAGPAVAAPVVLAEVASLNQLADNVRNWVVAILATIATAYLTIGGVRYLLSGGDAGEAERAKSAIRSAMIGYCLAILAPVVVAVLKSLVGA
jgi:succinate dehydrogenase/fumarate reductase cytochrome b subunit